MNRHEGPIGKINDFFNGLYKLKVNLNKYKINSNYSIRI